MSKYIPGNQKHLSLEDRKYIERSLNNGSSFKDIARFLCKDPTTISKEVKLHRVNDWYHKGSFLNAHNFCIHRYHCRKTNVCRKIILCNIKCTSCPTCNQTCPDFVKEQCNRLDKAPYVCNGCPKAIHHCSIAHKYRYDAVFADRKYKECLRAYKAKADGEAFVPFIKLHPHALRHTFYSLLYYSKVDPKACQQLMGHANISTTLNIYTHLSGEAVSEELRKVEGLVESEKSCKYTKIFCIVI